MIKEFLISCGYTEKEAQEKIEEEERIDAFYKKLEIVPVRFILKLLSKII
jgi:hypothetical protein